MSLQVRTAPPLIVIAEHKKTCFQTTSGHELPKTNRPSPWTSVPVRFANKNCVSVTFRFQNAPSYRDVGKRCLQVLAQQWKRSVCLLSLLWIYCTITKIYCCYANIAVTNKWLSYDRETARRMCRVGDFKGWVTLNFRLKVCVWRQYLCTIRWENGYATTPPLEVFTQRNFIRSELNLIKNKNSLWATLWET